MLINHGATMYRRYTVKQLEELSNQMKAERVKKEVDIVDLLRKNGYGVVEGKDAVLAKIDEIAERDAPLILDRP